MKLPQLPPRDQLVAIMARIYRNRLTTLSGGNLSIQETSGDLWITPAGTDKGQMVPEDIVCLKSGGAVEGRHRPSSEYPMHQAIYAARPDLRAIVHAHPAALVAYCITHQVPDTRLTPHTWQVCGRAGSAPYARPGSEQLGQQIAAAFAQGCNVVLLENHGATAAGPDLLTAYWRLEALDLAARTLLNARRVGDPVPLTDAQLSLAAGDSHLLPELVPADCAAGEDDLRRQIVQAVRLACDRWLMTGTQGVVSARAGARGLIITPSGPDRRALEVEDLVLVQDGRRQAGKIPSRSARLHSAIYDAHPDVGCVIMAPPPHAMAYAVTAATFNATAIPESSILLRDVPRVPYDTQFHAPEAVADALSSPTSVLLLQNNAVLAVGRSVPEAFDRLETVELTARALIDAGL